MRVIAGSCRSLPLVTPEGEETRPTSDRIKETLFNILQADTEGSVFYDLFCGSGGIGIEALSRGAKHCYFVDSSNEAIECLKKNLQFTKLQDLATVHHRDIFSAIPFMNDKADIIFMDPPYDLEIESAVMQQLKNSSILKEDSLVIIEAKKERDFSNLCDLGFTIIKEKVYKNNKHVFLLPKRETK